MSMVYRGRKKCIALTTTAPSGILPSTLARRRGGPKWVPFAVGSKIKVTNCAGAVEIGIFRGYRGTELGVLEIANGHMSRFAKDAKLELAPDDAHLSFDSTDYAELNAAIPKEDRWFAAMFQMTHDANAEKTKCRKQNQKQRKD